MGPRHGQSHSGPSGPAGRTHAAVPLGRGHYINTDYINIEYIDYIDYIDDYIDYINAYPPSSDSGGPILPLAVMPH